MEYKPLRGPCGIMDDVYETSAEFVIVIFPNIGADEPTWEIRSSPLDTGSRPYRNVHRIKYIHAKRTHICRCIQKVKKRTVSNHFGSFARTRDHRRTGENGTNNKVQHYTRIINVRRP